MSVTVENKTREVGCPICNNESGPLIKKGAVQYLQCSNCRTVFSGPVDNDNMVGGEYEFERNTKENHLRVARIGEMLKGDKESIKILDFGCGNGLLINDILEKGYQCDGYDAYSEKYMRLPPKNTYHLCVMVELIEHTSKPFRELDVVHRSLVDGGLVMIETGFVDVAKEEGIPIEEYFYIAPQSGHSTIFSHHGLDVLMALKGFKPLRHFNRHVRQYQKFTK